MGGWEKMIANCFNLFPLGLCLQITTPGLSDFTWKFHGDPQHPPGIVVRTLSTEGEQQSNLRILPSTRRDLLIRSKFVKSIAFEKMCNSAEKCPFHVLKCQQDVRKIPSKQDGVYGSEFSNTLVAPVTDVSMCRLALSVNPCNVLEFAGLDTSDHARAGSRIYVT
ncbi:uncharacterized protein BDR25DRAFT_348246 [Lindgomyces ingoldianus]|uniref:Uncharacterized protein n=1 Tax=Lindgomyces ingoldianus TaxID=673940 RepID=A0ACB6RGU4_9PLEO|nr:uncharacterized protein BDR25DRAFT_348246 [Lindgomyces ingoldianus]KAF2477955.1 hypothetical protein BDR25DRAFT_348246 [Lindgomyces ingoldianus]